MTKQFKLYTALSLDYPDNIISMDSCIKRGETFEYALSDFNFDKLIQLSVSLGQKGRISKYELYNEEKILDEAHFYQKGDAWYFYLSASETLSFVPSECGEGMLLLEITETTVNAYGKECTNIFDPEAFWVLNSLYSNASSEGNAAQALLVSEILYCSDKVTCRG